MKVKKSNVVLTIAKYWVLNNITFLPNMQTDLNLTQEIKWFFLKKFKSFESKLVMISNLLELSNWDLISKGGIT